MKITVAADGSRRFTTLQAAIDSLPDDITSEVIIYIKKGVYREKVFIDKPFITLIGENAEETILEYGDYAKMKSPEGDDIGTFCTYTFFSGGHDFRAENMTFVNTAGNGEDVGQAIAAYVDGDRSMFVNCRFIGNQDTLFTGPLPPYPLTVKRFGGPRDGMPRIMSRQYYQNCYVQGDIDFIFGSATAVFEDCEIFSNRLRPGAESFITTSSTPEGEKYGYVFINCRLTGDAAPESVYLGRPWRNFGKAAFMNCRMGPHIRNEGWHNWDKPESENSVVFAEYGSSGPGGKAYQLSVAGQTEAESHTEAASHTEAESQTEAESLAEAASHTEAESLATNAGSGDTVNFQDGACTKMTVVKRVEWSRLLSKEEAELYRAYRVLSGEDGWLDYLLHPA